MLSRACDEVMVRVKVPLYRIRPQLYWWTAEIAELRDALRTASEVARTRTDSVERIVAADKHMEARRRLTRAIRRSKSQMMEELIALATDNVFGDVYKILHTRLHGYCAPSETNATLLQRIVNDSFPQHPPFHWSVEESSTNDSQQSVPRISEEELLVISGKLATRKAPGLDGISNAVLRTAIREYAGLFRQVYQNCLDRGHFPVAWKRQRLVLLPKPGKPPGNSSSFRPLGMIDGAGKIMERLILNRLNDYIENPVSQLSPAQFGFRRGRSSVMAVQRVVQAGVAAMQFHRTNNREKRCLMIVSLDVRNAFNSASWSSTAAALQAKGVATELQRILASWFDGRQLVYDTDGGPVTRSLSAGVPQGSILGPTLWNIMYDGVLDLELPEGVEIVGYADDLALLVPGTTPQQASQLASTAVAIIADWMSSRRLELAPAKTEVVMI